METVNPTFIVSVLVLGALFYVTDPRVMNRLVSPTTTKKRSNSRSGKRAS